MKILGLGLSMESITMMERPSRTLKVAGSEIMCTIDNFKMELCLMQYVFRHRRIINIFNKRTFNR